jgi:hypothetical protein
MSGLGLKFAKITSDWRGDEVQERAGVVDVV